MTIRNLPKAMWPGLGLVAASSLMHLWLEIDRGMTVAPRLKAGSEHVAHTYEVITVAQGLRRAVQDAERGQRSYLITSDAAHLDAFHKGVQEAPALLAKLKQLTSDNPEQQRRWPVLEHQVNIKLDELKRTLEIHEHQGFEVARTVVQTNVRLDAMQAINGVIDAAIAAERALLTESLARTAEFERAGRDAAFAGGVLAIAVLVLGIILVLAAFRNILKAQAAQHESELFLRGIFVGNPDAVLVVDRSGAIVRANPQADIIFGTAPGTLVGRSVSALLPERVRAQHESNIASFFASPRRRSMGAELVLFAVRADGTEFPVDIMLSPLQSRQGELVIAVVRDISERRQQQQALEQTRAALAQSQKMDALGQITGGIAHDFNNLIHVIKNAAGLLERRLHSTDPDVRNYLEMLKRNADRAASLTQRLLAFSRRQVLDPKPINANNLIVEVTALLKQALGESIAIETVAGAGVWWISADANQLETAILNLALNARDAMAGSGKLTIEVSNAFLDEDYAAAHTEVKPGQYVMLAVSDTGSGMTKEVAANAFNPFFTTKEMGRGTGLGLSQVYGFIKQSGGHAKIYSEPGEGTTVKLYLPRLSSVPLAQIQPKAPSAPGGTEKETVLVVEDEDDVCQFTADVLGELGYRVLTARDAASALRVLEEESDVNLLFTDIGLSGGVNGRELADAALRRFPALRVLFTTGYTRNAIIHHGRLDPGVDLITKPFTQTSLAEKVRQVLDGDASNPNRA